MPLKLDLAFELSDPALLPTLRLPLFPVVGVFDHLSALAGTTFQIGRKPIPRSTDERSPLTFPAYEFAGHIIRHLSRVEILVKHP